MIWMFYEEKMSLALKEVDCHFVLHSLQFIPSLEWWPIILEVKKKNWPNVDWDDHWFILDQQMCELHILQLCPLEMGWIYVFTSTDLGPNGGLWFFWPYFFPLSFQVRQFLEGKQTWGRQQSTSALGLRTFHTVHGAALADSDPVSSFCSSRAQELSNPSCHSGIPQPGSLLSWTTEFGPDPFCCRPFPSRTHSEQKLCTSYHPAFCYSGITGLRENLAKWTG